MPNSNPSISQLKPFVKGDKRINRKGRPRSFDSLRALAQQIATERAAGRDVTVIENMLREFSKSRNPVDRHKFIEIAYGKVPDKLDVTSLGKALPDMIGVKLIDYRNSIAETEAGPGADSSAPGQDKNTGDGPKMG